TGFSGAPIGLIPTRTDRCPTMAISSISCRCSRPRRRRSVGSLWTTRSGSMASAPERLKGDLRRQPSPFDDVPGTTLLDAARPRQGYHLNMFCMSLMKPANREQFKANEAGYLNRFPLTQEQRDAVLKRDWNRMIALGGNIYFLAKLFSTDGLSFQHVAAEMTGSTQEAYAQM